MPDTGFPYSANSDAQVLILGSMPGRKSLAAKEYYAHPKNAFWPIMAELFGFNAGLAYDARMALLRENGIALWDVAHQCVRPGSMDHAIEIGSVIANDFASFFNTHTQIQAIFFNGIKAGELFHRLVLDELPPWVQQIDRQALPSTSPAHATMKFSDKCVVWRKIKQALENESTSPYLSSHPT
ncbi:MAG TPA: DNA-deoxyinosine glycosylase [Mariprofundaceae bacterium]|nr:DNA-deoxyinosine glycosylase [Mariprofundaceae bacterium]